MIKWRKRCNTISARQMIVMTLLWTTMVWETWFKLSIKLLQDQCMDTVLGYQLQEHMQNILEARLHYIVCKDLEQMCIYVSNILMTKETTIQHFEYRSKYIFLNVITEGNKYLIMCE